MGRLFNDIRKLIKSWFVPVKEIEIFDWSSSCDSISSNECSSSAKFDSFISSSGSSTDDLLNFAGDELEQRKNMMEDGPAAHQVKILKSELLSIQDRCSFLEEQISRLEESDMYDMLRKQVEVLLAEKGRLVQENMKLARENQRLMDLTSSVEDVTGGSSTEDEEEESQTDEDMMRMQMEVLMAEKGRLAQENINLARQNQLLAEMVDFTWDCSSPVDDITGESSPCY